MVGQGDTCGLLPFSPPHADLFVLPAAELTVKLKEPQTEGSPSVYCSSLVLCHARASCRGAAGSSKSFLEPRPGPA